MYRAAGGASSGGGSSGEVHAVGAGKCLDVPNSTQANGTQLDIWTCAGGSNQIWTSTSSRQLTVYSGRSQKCLDAFNNQTTPGTKVEIWSCNGGGEPAVAAQLQRHHHRRAVRAVPGRDRGQHEQRRPG
jgi:alpha-galactosidase